MKLSLVFLAALTAFVFADDMETDPCPNDTTGYCMNMYAIKYTNQLRGKKLMSGSMGMFQNAMRHSKVQDSRGDIFHQPLQNGIRVGSGECADTLAAENVAYYENPRIKNAAMYCVLDLWKNSPGHYSNMVNPSMTTVVIAIYRHNGRVTCTQTFTRKPRTGSGQCAAALPASAGKEPSRPAPKPEKPMRPTPQPMMREMPIPESKPMQEKPMMEERMMRETPMKKEEPMMEEKPMMRPMKKPRYQLRYKSLTLTKVDGTKKTIIQKCFGSSCYYCVKSKNRCFGFRASYHMDMLFRYYGW